MALDELVDILSEQTAIYTKLLAERNRTPEYEQAKKTIKLIQAEIGGRKNGNSDLFLQREENTERT